MLLVLQNVVMDFNDVMHVIHLVGVQLVELWLATAGAPKCLGLKEFIVSSLTSKETLLESDNRRPKAKAKLPQNHLNQYSPPAQNDCPISWIFFGPQMIVWLCLARNLRLKIICCAPNFLCQEFFQHRNFWGRFGVR